MASLPEHNAGEDAGPLPRTWRLWLRRLFVMAIVALLAIVAFGWVQREQIARDLIGEQLESLGVAAQYDILDISTDRQILENIIVGDPDRPDLTVKRVEVMLVYDFGIPEIGRVTLIEPRLYGTYRNGKLSFGSLDAALFDNSSDTTGLPALDIKLVDGRGLIESDFGPLGLKVAGEGRLDGGFSGIVAAIAPQLDAPECKTGRTSFFGAIALESDAIKLNGPLRSTDLNCSGFSSAAQRLDAAVDLSIRSDFSSFTSKNSVVAKGLSSFGVRAGKLAGDADFALDGQRLDSKFDLTASSIGSPQFSAGSLRLAGSLRGADSLARLEAIGTVSGRDITPGASLDEAFAGLAETTKGTLAESLLNKFRRAMGKELRNGNVLADFTARKAGNSVTLIMPQAVFKNRGGARLASFSQVQFLQRGSDTPRISGNFRTGGNDLPQIAGRMERDGSGQSLFRLRMDEYIAQTSRAAIPELLVTQSPSGAISFTGQVEASGPLPGGGAQGLRIPVSGNWNQKAGLSVWNSCTEFRFDRLSLANLELANRSAVLCPARNSAILRQTGSGLKIAAGIASLDLAGTLGGTRIEVTSGPIGFAYPGFALAEAVDVELGTGEEVSRFSIARLKAVLGQDINGEFSGADISLAAVPLDLKGSAGMWSYGGNALRISDGQFTLVDRISPARFEPLVSRGASLSLYNSIITANASLLAPKSGRVLSDVAITHDLGSGSGYADLLVQGLLFDESLQPDELTPLALGVVANADGIVTGSGRIDWSPEKITSSGAFSSDKLDFAAVFGPVKGAAGTIEFVDLISLTTAPNQSVRVASINPGIEAKDGIIGFSLVDGQILGVTGGKWPFMGGTLELLPVQLNLGIAERRSYILVVKNVDSALFVENMELGNIAATGIFDGELPIVFDELGFGQITGGVLKSRAPGGNVSYVGELTYEDLSPIGNYAFDTLKSLDYTSMRIDMDGPLTGDIVTKLRFDGVKQGAGTKQNFITRQIADLPIRFNVNITAPFYQLFDILQSIYDPATVRDPREIGLFTDDGKRFIPVGAPQLPPPHAPAPVPARPPDGAIAIRPSEPAIQTSDSEELP